jgi:D-glycero-D-manno-heptose 1,7-bisphosphate phosphatase
LKALFLDRDGTLIVDVPYLADPTRVKLLPGVREGFVRARALGYRLFLFTNQSGVGRGYFTLEDALRCNARMVELLELGSDVFAGSCIAPESPDQPSVYRKPSPRFILEMIAAHGLDPTQCVMVGDRESDVRAGLNAGTRAAGVCTGEYDAATWQRLAIPGVTVHADFAAFAKTLT